MSNNVLAAADLPKLIADVYAALKTVGSATAEAEADQLKPAVSVRKSITPDYIISLEDGRKFKSMKRHLGLLGMPTEEYRSKWKLPRDHPMVAPNYSAKRSQLARPMALAESPTHRHAKESARGRPTCRQSREFSCQTDRPDGLRPR